MPGSEEPGQGIHLPLRDVLGPAPYPERFPCKIHHLPLDCYCNSGGVNSQYIIMQGNACLPYEMLFAGYRTPWFASGKV
jgi:hypothetical protein